MLTPDTATRESEGPSHSIVLRLDPGAMDNPDIEIRWEIERKLRDHAPDVSFFDDGYGFARHPDAMLLIYATSQAETLVEALVAVLQELEVFYNGLAHAAIIAVASRVVAPGAGEEFEDHRVVYPSTLAGVPLPD